METSALKWQFIKYTKLKLLQSNTPALKCPVNEGELFILERVQLIQLCDHFGRCNMQCW